MVNIIITVKIGFGSVIAQAQLMIRGNIIIYLQADGFAVDIALPFFTGAVLEVAAVLIIIINMVANLALASLGIQLIFSGAEVAGRNINAGFVVNEAGKSNKTYSENIINAGDIELGKLRAAMGNNAIGLSLKDLAKHMLIVGTPGSGKTTFSVGLLDRLWKEHHIPFLVIEPAKNEYRALVQSIPDLQVFTPGKNFISPFVFNPFCPPKNVRLETYKSTLKTAFAAGLWCRSAE